VWTPLDARLIEANSVLRQDYLYGGAHINPTSKLLGLNRFYKAEGYLYYPDWPVPILHFLRLGMATAWPWTCPGMSKTLP
jgi:hypothetical protein